MVGLLVAAPAPAETEIADRFGGRPLVEAAGRPWPTCRGCSGPMQFLGQVVLDGGGMLSLFMCQNNPGMCDDWDPNEGGNAGFVIDTSGPMVLMDPPPGDETLLGGSWGTMVREVEVPAAASEEHGSAYDVARGDAAGRTILGMIGGLPSWVQADETPQCDACSAPMDFAVQLEEGPEEQTAMNFGGGGVAYAFRCRCGAAKMLWQQ